MIIGNLGVVAADIEYHRIGRDESNIAGSGNPNLARLLGGVERFAILRVGQLEVVPSIAQGDAVPA